jgi:cytoskeletal protein CcmA (bactofilin family)
MHRYKTQWVLSLALVVILCGFSGQQSDNEWELSVVERGEVHEGWYFGAGETVRIEGTVNGDVYAAASRIEITGTVNGDVLAAGGTVEISGTVTEDVRAAGGSVRISGTVEGNCTLAGGELDVTRDGLVKDNVLGFGGTIRISGKTEGELKVAGGELVVRGEVGRDLHFEGGKLQIRDGATVGGNATIYIGDADDADIADGAVAGTVTIKTRDDNGEPTILGAPSGTFWFNLVYGLSLMFMALVFALVMPVKTLEARAMLTQSFGMTVLWGFLGLIAVPVAVVVLFVLVIGIPLGLFVLVLYLWFLYLSQLSLPLLASSWIAKGESIRGWRLFWPIALGVVVLQLLMLIPYLGFLVWLLGAFLGMGVFLRLVSKVLTTTSKG